MDVLSVPKGISDCPNCTCMLRLTGNMLWLNSRILNAR